MCSIENAVSVLYEYLNPIFLCDAFLSYYLITSLSSVDHHVFACDEKKQRKKEIMHNN